MYVIQLIAFRWDTACIRSSPDPSLSCGSGCGLRDLSLNLAHVIHNVVYYLQIQLRKGTNWWRPPLTTLVVLVSFAHPDLLILTKIEPHYSFHYRHPDQQCWVSLAWIYSHFDTLTPLAFWSPWRILRDRSLARMSDSDWGRFRHMTDACSLPNDCHMTDTCSLPNDWCMTVMWHCFLQTWSTEST